MSYLHSPNIVLGETLRDVSLVTNTEMPLSPRRFSWRWVGERLVLVDEEKAEEAEEEGVRDLKRRREKKASTSTSTLVDVSFERTQSANLSKYQTIRVSKEAGEGPSEAHASSLGTVVKLLKVSMTFKHYYKSLKDFMTFTGAVSVKLDIFEITKRWAERSFIFGFHNKV